ncbi:MAG TPA: DinB family protein [Pyrinomonadaceae bacterium]|nr:DinB family protein [Pyrinomonadaceae bacterium]
MKATDLLVLNLEEVRRRSVKVWLAIPADGLHWRPDDAAMSCVEVVRHVLEGEYLYTRMLKSGASLASDESPFTGRPYTSVVEELAFAEPYRRETLELVRSYSPEDLRARKVDRSDVGYVREAGDFILRMAYHESVHAGQLLGYLRSMGAARPNVWD